MTEVSRRSFVLGAAATTGLAAINRPVLAGAASSAERPSWIRVETNGAPPARSDHALAYDAASELVYMFGGHNKNGPLHDVWTFGSSTDTWTELPPDGKSPPPRFTPNVLFDEQRARLVIAMGQGSGFLNDVWAFDPDERTWTELAAGGSDGPKRRYGSASAYDPEGDRFFVSHGFTSSGRFDDTWAFDLATDSWSQLSITGSLPLKRCLVRGAWDAEGGKFMLFGGQSNVDLHMNDLWVLNVTGGRWRKRNDEVRPRDRNLYGAAFDDAGRRWFVFGGDGESGPLRDLWSYDVAAKGWSRHGKRVGRPSARTGPDVIVAGTRLILFGGHDGSKYLDDTWTIPI